MTLSKSICMDLPLARAAYRGLPFFSAGHLTFLESTQDGRLFRREEYAGRWGDPSVSVALETRNELVRLFHDARRRKADRSLDEPGVAVLGGSGGSGLGTSQL